MSRQTTNISIRMDKELKEEAEDLFASLGMNMTTAMNVFVRQSVRQGRIPFEITRSIPNAETLVTIHEVEEMISGKIPKKTIPVADFAKNVESDLKKIFEPIIDTERCRFIREENSGRY